MSTATSEQKDATAFLAQNALIHPLWELDAHVDALKAAGFDSELISKLSLAISEAILYSRSLVLERAKADGWNVYPKRTTTGVSSLLWEDPETGLFWETQSLIEEYLSREAD